MFKKILIANRGEIAVRVIRACRDMGIQSVAIYSEADANALHVHLADEAVCIGEPRSYLDLEKIVNVCKEVKAEAVHPGYGFLSENTVFADRLKEAGITFIGPTPEAVLSMGDKAVARDTMIKAGVPVVPGTEGIITALEQAERMAEEVGYPVIIKASAGGGGRGMRIAATKNDLENAIRAAKTEAKSAFANDEVYMEKYIEEPRHVEIQILADNFGNVVYLGERDCSIQRRHQKLLEESPSPVITPAIRKRMGELACAAARAVKYTGAGTVEFLVDKHLNFYFMEMNTRIQVEHPVTEMVTGKDLIKGQILVAAGKPLPYTQDDITVDGHAIECRINAENPLVNFMPNPGTVSVFVPPGGYGVRVDSAMYPGYTIPMFYDSMICKLIVWGKTREQAIERMKRALREFVIEGVPTTIPFHLLVLDNEYFRKGDFYTNFIQLRMSDKPLREQLDDLGYKKPSLPAGAAPAPVPQAAPAAQPLKEGEVSPEVVAAISAAIAAYGEASGTSYAIRGIQRTPSESLWRLSGWQDLMARRVL